MKKDKLNFFQPKEEKNLGQWLMEQGISAGFPSPADDFKEIRISLDKELVKNGDATFYAKVSGDSMINAGIYNNDIIIVDRSIKPKHGKIVVAALDGQMTIKRLYHRDDKIMLLPENELFKPIEILDSMDMVIWGVATNVIHSL